MFLDKIKIGIKLSFGFGAVILMLAIVSATSLIRLSEFNHSVEDLAKDDMPKQVYAANWAETLLQSSRYMQEVLILDDEKHIKEGIGNC